MPVTVRLTVFSALVLGACSSEPRPNEAQGLALEVAPLSLPGLDFACYDVRVAAGSGETRQTVWQKGDPARTRLGHDQDLPPSADNPASLEADSDALCTSRYGNGEGGDLTYVGPCDSQSDTSAAAGIQNEVTIWIDGLYATDGETTSELGDWRDPCGADGCSLSFDCAPNRDTLVRFDFTVMRDANQGFFDVAVNFEDIFCSAKVDCSYDAAGQDPIRLLFGPDGQRGQTAVAALACTAGPGADTGTVLHMNGVRVQCGEETAGSVALPFTCIGNEAFGITAEMATGGQVSASAWDLTTGAWSALPVPVDSEGGIVLESIDDDTLVGLALTAPFTGGAFEGRLAMWRKNAGVWTLASVATGGTYLVDALDAFACFGNFSSGWCLARVDGPTLQNVRWSWSSGVIGTGALIAYPAGESSCADLEFGHGNATGMAIRTCQDDNGGLATAYAWFSATAQYVALPLPANTAAMPTPSSVVLVQAEPFDTSGAVGSSALGMVRFTDAVGGAVNRVVRWTWTGAAFNVAEVAGLDMGLGRVFLGGASLYEDATPELQQLLRFDGAWRRYTGGFAFWDGDGYEAADRVLIDGFEPGFGVAGMVYGRIALAGQPLVPFYSYVPTNETAPFIVGGPLAAGNGFLPFSPQDLPTADARFEGTPSWYQGNTRTLRVHYVWEVGSAVAGYVWHLTPSGVQAWGEVAYASMPNDLIGVRSPYAGFTHTPMNERLPRCEPLIGADSGALGPYAVRWAWPPATNGDTLSRLDLELPSDGQAGQFLVDLDPTVQGNGYPSPLAGQAVWQYGVYRGTEQLACGGSSCNKVYWNTAIGFDPTRPDCTLHVEATAAPSPGLVGGLTPADSAAWPVIVMQVPLTRDTGDGVEVVCRQNPLNGNGSGVTTTYTQPGEALGFCHRFDGTTASSLEGCDWTPIEVPPPPTGIACDDGLDCNDQDDCTIDTCLDNLCSYEVLDSPACAPME
jgi:hypothetical protein